MKLQFDHYWDAIRVMNIAVAESYCNACEISGVAVPDSGWPTDGVVDHRMIQSAHDLAATAWRHFVNPPEPAYVFTAPPVAGDRDVAAWLSWLRAEIRGWAMERPDLIALCVRIFQNQNVDAGYEAEDRLRGYLRGRYQHISWR